MKKELIVERFIKWLSNKFGYKIVMVKIGSKKSSGIFINGDKELLRYTDISGYTFKKEPLKREQKKL
jgi:hypothetical protein